MPLIFFFTFSPRHFSIGKKQHFLWRDNQMYYFVCKLFFTWKLLFSVLPRIFLVLVEYKFNCSYLELWIIVLIEVTVFTCFLVMISEYIIAIQWVPVRKCCGQHKWWVQILRSLCVSVVLVYKKDHLPFGIFPN